MGLRLSKDLRNQQNSANGFDILGIENKDYNLEELEALKNRKLGKTPLNVQVSNKNDKPAPGAFCLGETAKSLSLTDIEYNRYLLNEKTQQQTSNNSSQPVVSLRRPIVIVEEGTKDTTQNKPGKTIYDELILLQNLVENLSSELAYYKNNTATTIAVDSEYNLITKHSMIPTVGAVHKYVATYAGIIRRSDYMDGEIFGIVNGRITLKNGEYTVILNDESYNMIRQPGENNMNYYTLRIGG